MPANGFNQTRSLDRMLRQLRSLLRSHRLPRPDRLVLSTVSRSVTMQFITGTGPDRLAAVLLWAHLLQGVTLAWGHTNPGQLTVALTGRTSSGLSISAGAEVELTELAGHLHADRPDLPTAHLANGLYLPLGVVEPVSYEELAAVIHAARTTVPLPRVEVAA
ncbi:hypothetical protein [Crossiella sp. CA198]|uniref:hypothetical protein n=1 Tax=Crossiella sp. CA198 TaxID=3455607 RepID=UPI003F8D6776